MQSLYVLVIGILEFFFSKRIISINLRDSAPDSGTAQDDFYRRRQMQFYSLEESLVQFFNMIITFCNFNFMTKLRQIEIQINYKLTIKQIVQRLQKNWKYFKIQFFTVLFGWLIQLLGTIILYVNFSEQTVKIVLALGTVYNMGFQLLVMYHTLNYILLFYRVIDFF